MDKTPDEARCGATAALDREQIRAVRLAKAMTYGLLLVK
jgi:hypothetical protein